MEKMEDYQPPIQPDIQTIDTLMSDPSKQNIQAYIEEVMRSNHYCLLNALPPIPGTKWPVTEEIWWHFYEVLPPLSYPQKNNGFAICEAKIENVHSAYYLEDGQYWHEYVVLKG